MDRTRLSDKIDSFKRGGDFHNRGSRFPKFGRARRPYSAGSFHLGPQNRDSQTRKRDSERGSNQEKVQFFHRGTSIIPALRG